MKTKIISAVVFFLTLLTFKAQALSAYPVIYIPKNISDFSGQNSYGVRGILVKDLLQKNYKVTDEKQDLKNCKVLVADVKDKSGLFKTKILVTFKDCKKNTVFEEEAVSEDEDLQTGYQKALRQALDKIPDYNPNATLLMDPQDEAAKAKVSDHKNSNVIKTPSFVNSGIIYQKIEVGNGKFILLEPGATEAYATFSNSTKAGVYRVSLKNLDMTLGYEENGNLVIEMPQKEGGFKKEIFRKE